MFTEKSRRKFDHEESHHLTMVVHKLMTNTVKINSESTYYEICDALYNFESPAYHYWACGTGTDVSKSSTWSNERARLNELFKEKLPHLKVVEKKTLLSKIRNTFNRFSTFLIMRRNDV
jgi:hypothetical protein